MIRHSLRRFASLTSRTGIRSYTAWPMLKEEQVMIAEMARSFADAELVPNAAKYDADHRFPREQISKIAKPIMIWR